MDPNRWERVNELFHAAIARGSSERATFLATACAGDEELAREVDRLVRAHERTRGFLEGSMATEVLRAFGSANALTTLESSFASFRIGSAFRGTDRFTVRRRLGAGGMGMVYEVHDRDRDEVVALKTLLRTSGADIYRLKREFRSLADVAHPNLVSLYELIVEDTACFFTMELVEGVGFVEYVRGPGAGIAPIDYEKVRRVFAQLVEGIGALHRAGKLHRDIKPSNILITPAERVVILDFGLTSDVMPPAAIIGESMAGTPAYLAPERHARAAPSESQDWYSVGVTLYEALTGHVPFAGDFEEMALRKRQCDAPPPSQTTRDVPEDLNAICRGLLRRNAAERLSGWDAVQMLERRAGVTDAPAPEMDVEPVFVGRRRQLEALQLALTRARQGAATTVYVHGPSGIGKSALVQHFLEGALAREAIVVLRGRCYERESVPYKALDGVIDSLSQYLRALPRSEAALLLPANVAALLRLFPVMLQVKAATAARDHTYERAEPAVLRQQGFEALRDLLARIAARQPVIVHIDDLHWADADSAALLEDLLRPPHAPPILMVACFRAEEVATKPFLQALIAPATATRGISLPLEPMSEDDARALLVSALGTASSVSDTVMRLADDARGNPFLLRHLAGYLAARRGQSGRTTFAEMLDDRVSALPAAGKVFLETLAICGRPMEPQLIYAAAGLEGDERPLVARLRAEHLLRASGSAHRVELYHDRIRETLAATVAGEDKRQLHASLARTLIARGTDDPEALFEHLLASDHREAAATQAGRAGDRAASSLAFERAALFYRQALELDPASETAFLWQEGHARALANAGKPAEAAEAYLRASERAAPHERVDLQRRAAEQFLIGGHMDRGLDLIRSVLTGLGVRVPDSPAAALRLLLWARARLWWRGLRFATRAIGDVDSSDLLRIDTCWSAATGLGLVDPISGVGFSARHLRMALDSGELTRITRGLALEAGIRSTSSRGRRSGELLLRRARELAIDLGTPEALALPTVAEGMIALMGGQWKTAGQCAERVLPILRDECVGLTWELNLAQNLSIWARMYQGELRDLTERVPAIIADARSRGNFYMVAELCTRGNYVWLVADDPDEGERQALDSIQRWSSKGFHRLHYSALLTRVQTALYRGDGHAAWRLLDEQEENVWRSLLTRVQLLRVELLYLRARTALAMASVSNNADTFLRIARGRARRIERERLAWADPIALLVRAGIAAIEEDVPLALRHLHAAADRFTRADMNLYAAVSRRRIGALQPDGHGRAMRRASDEYMAAQTIANPGGMTQMLAPGFRDDRSSASA